jgi:hypothetical protein
VVLGSEHLHAVRFEPLLAIQQRLQVGDLEGDVIWSWGG